MIKHCCLIALLISSEITLASQWDDLWLRRDQQAKKLLDQQHYEAAAERFENQDWQGAAQYRAGHFEQAAQKFSQDATARGHYNYGNALAQQGKLTDALKAYDRALKQQPNFPDAQFNRKLVEDALKKQSEKKSQEKQEEKQNQNQNQQSESGQGKQTDDKQDHQSGSEQKQDSPKSEESPQKKNAKGQNQQKLDSNPETESEKLAKKGQDQNNPKPAQQAEEQKKPNSDQNAQSPENAQKEGEKGLSSQELSNQAQEKADLQQWLQKIPDDPAGLLRRKFLRDHQRRQWGQQG